MRPRAMGIGAVGHLCGRVGLRLSTLRIQTYGAGRAGAKA